MANISIDNIELYGISLKSQKSNNKLRNNLRLTNNLRLNTQNSDLPTPIRDIETKRNSKVHVEFDYSEEYSDEPSVFNNDKISLNNKYDQTLTNNFCSFEHSKGGQFSSLKPVKQTSNILRGVNISFESKDSKTKVNRPEFKGKSPKIYNRNKRYNSVESEKVSNHELDIDHDSEFGESSKYGIVAAKTRNSQKVSISVMAKHINPSSSQLFKPDKSNR